MDVHVCDSKADLEGDSVRATHFVCKTSRPRHGFVSHPRRLVMELVMAGLARLGVVSHSRLLAMELIIVIAAPLDELLFRELPVRGIALVYLFEEGLSNSHIMRQRRDVNTIATQNSIGSVAAAACAQASLGTDCKPGYFSTP